MKKTALFLAAAVLFLAANVFATGDLLVTGNLGVGTTNPTDKVVIQIPGDMGGGINAVSGLVLKAPDSQGSPALTFTGGGPNGGDIGKITYDSGNDRFFFSGGSINLGLNYPISWQGMSNIINVPSSGNAVFHFNTSINLETKSDNTGKVIIPFGNIGIGTTTPTAKLQVTGGDAAITTQGKGIILKATDGPNCYRITVNNTGVLSAGSPVTCP